jgi:hypothetical protein
MKKNSEPTVSLKWWLRAVGAFYLLQFFMMAVVRAPIQTQGPAGTLERYAAGDALAGFVVETWVIFALQVGATGLVMLMASRSAAQAVWLAWAAIAIELGRGIVADLWLYSRGTTSAALIGTWLLIHSAIIVTGLLALRRSSPVLAPAEVRS